MKKIRSLLLLWAVVACCAVGVAACGNNAERTVSKAELVSVTGFTMQGNGGYITVSKDTESFSFVNKITVSDNATWVISRDEYGENLLAAKAAPIEYGDNTFYLIVTSGDGNSVNVYRMTVRRSLPVYRVYFDLNMDGGAYYNYNNICTPQDVESGSFATVPTVTPVKLGCVFNGWVFNFNTPITQSITIKARWGKKPEMLNFIFTSTDTVCTVTGVNKTVTEITVPDYVTSIGDSTFADCSKLTSVTIGNGVKVIGDSAFNNCSSLTSISVGQDNPNYSSQDGILYNKGKTEILFVPQRISGAVSLPDTLTIIGYRAFSGCSSLTSITIPDSVTSIGNMAFYYCRSLREITIPDSVTSIGGAVFWDCSSLSEITIPDSVTSIGDVMFGFCSSLSEITIPVSVTSIGNDAFSYCSSLTDIYYSGTTAQWEEIIKGNDWKKGVSTSCVVHCNGGDIDIAAA